MTLQEMDVHCPRCGRHVTLGEIDFSGDQINCPDCWDEILMAPSDIRQALELAESEASNHGSNYSAGMRLARHLIEKELLEEVRSDDPRE